MNVWISVALLGAVLTVIGFFVFIRKYQFNKPQKKSIFIVGIFIPMFFAFSYAETLQEFFPQLTLFDLGAFYLIGMISGFFVAIYLLQRKAVVSKDS
jgi:hypothetical protein